MPHMDGVLPLASGLDASGGRLQDREELIRPQGVHRQDVATPGLRGPGRRVSLRQRRGGIAIEGGVVDVVQAESPGREALQDLVSIPDEEWYAEEGVIRRQTHGCRC